MTMHGVLGQTAMWVADEEHSAARSVVGDEMAYLESGLLTTESLLSSYGHPYMARAW